MTYDIIQIISLTQKLVISRKDQIDLLLRAGVCDYL